MVTLPVPSAQALRDNEIQALPHGLLSLVAKQGFGPGIPETNLAVPVGKDNRLLRAFHNLLAQPLVRIRRHVKILLTLGQSWCPTVQQRAEFRCWEMQSYIEGAKQPIDGTGFIKAHLGD